ncbi:MAG TPA: CvpA family protein, partial [Bryobacteraceae bacterium]|nr:CvpA family protein [Bryobacteraceae bacterium]
MNWLDVVLLLILVVSVVASYRKGLSRELIGLASVVAGLLLGSWFYGSVAAYLAPHLSSRKTANFLGFLIVFCGILMLGALVSWILGKFLKVTGLSFFDHVLGAGFGILRGTLIGVALLMAVLAFSESGKPPDSVVHSRVAPYVAGAARIFVAMAPHELKEGFRKTYGQAREAWERAWKNGIHTAPEPEKGKNEKRI